MITQVEKWWSLIRQNPGPIIICSVSAFLAGASAGSGIGYLFGSYGHDDTKRELSHCERDTDKKENELNLVRAELDNKKSQLREACKGEDFDKLKDDNDHLRTSIDKCEKDATERNKSVAQAQREINLLKNRGDEVEGKNRAQLAKIDSIQAQYDKAKEELSRCQKVANEKSASQSVQCATLAEQIRKNATEHAGSFRLDELNRPLYKLRKDLQCNRFER